MLRNKTKATRSTDAPDLQGLRPPSTACMSFRTVKEKCALPPRCSRPRLQTERPCEGGSEDRTVRVPSRRLRSDMSKFISKPSAPAAASPLSSPHAFDRTRTHKKQFILHKKIIHTSLQRGRIKKFTSECIGSFTRTNQAFFSSRRALLIREVLKWPLFRFASLLEGPGWWLLG